MSEHRIDQFRILSELGHGGMGTVHLAEAVADWGPLAAGDRLALKVFHPHLRGEGEVEQRFLQEAELGASLDSEHVVRTFGGGRSEGPGGTPVTWLAMELVEGQTLRSMLREIGPFPEPLAILLARQAAAALQVIHAAGIVHRDIKPENLLVTPDHRLKVMDLGVARLQEASIQLSKTGEFLGSLPYAAPEQFDDGVDVDPRADLYSLGVVLYELLTGRNPFQATDPFATIRRHMDLVPDKPGMVNPQVSHMVEELVMTLLEKDRANRFASSEALLDALELGSSSDWWQARQTIALRDSSAQRVRRLRIPRETPVFGRDTELDRLEELYAEAAGGTGRVVLVMGEAGIGKTRLVDELVARVDAMNRPFQVLQGGTPPEGALRPLQPFSEALVERLGEDRLDEALLPLLTASPLLVPAFAAFLRGSPAPAGAEPLTRDSVLTVAAQAIRALAERRTTILVVDDLHFADESTRRLFTLLARQAADLPLLLVATARPDPGLRDLLPMIERVPGAQRIDLARLGPRETVALLREYFGSQEMVDQLGLRVLEKADGNPFFLFEIVRGLRERGAITARPDGTWVAGLTEEDVEVPNTVRDLLVQRLADLDEDEMDILHAAAVQGFEFDPEVVGDALDVARLPLLKRLGKLERRHRLVMHFGYRYHFDHHLVREIVYDDLAPALREEYHRLVAEALRARAAAPEVVAQHYFKSSRPREGLDDLLAGIERLKAAFQNEAGLALCERGLAVLPEEGDADLLSLRFEVLLQMASFLDRVGARDRQEETLALARAAAERLGGPERSVRLFDSLSGMYANTGRYEEARQAAERALRTAAEAKDVKGETKACKSLGMVAWSVGRLEDARSLYERSLELAHRLEDRKEEADALNNLGTVAENTGDYEAAAAYHERALAIRRDIGDRWGEGHSMSHLGIVAYHRGDYGTAREDHEQALKLRREVGDRQGEANSLNNLGAVAHYLGRYDDARRYHEDSLRLKRQSGDRAGEATSLNNLANVAYARDDLVEAERLHSLAVDIRREIGDMRGQAYSVSNLGLVMQDLGRLGRARELHEQALVLNRRVGDSAGAAIALACLGSLATLRGDFDEAEQRLEEALASTRDLRDARGESYALASLAELRRQRGDLAGGRTDLEQALALRRSLRYSHGIMMACLQLGDLLDEMEETERARACLLEARDLARGLGRPTVALKADARLALLEGHPWDGLVPRSLPPAEEIELRWTLLRLARRLDDTDAAARHEGRLTELLVQVAETLPPEERSAYWENVSPNREIGGRGTA